MTERFEVARLIAADRAEIFALLRSPAGHVAIDSSGMLQSADGPAVTAVGDEFVVHMDRESLNDRPMGKYDVRVIITAYVEGDVIEWTVAGMGYPPLEHRYGYQLESVDGGTRVTSYYDWSRVHNKLRGVFPIIPEAGIRATLGILARTVETP
ncbi:polyketide cyclase [Gordonia sp. LSe1-13]|uniref:Polyketide cyclase n=1 Tax=Gordonia sesuvii TaxID=3116777 RepID=A0ABU7MJ30_9ACTN|nr:polyketide cyclase [Gordonia sp. LSe1-13]